MQISLHYTTDQERIGFAKAALYPISGLSNWARSWFDATSLKPFINCGVGPNFPIWDNDDYWRLLESFPPDCSVIKLSVAAPTHPDSSWDVISYRDEFTRRKQRLAAAGYEWEYYDPDGLARGAGCGSQLKPHNLDT
ncbi:MAG: hypothetical protein ACE5HX_19410 [bacterium]